MRRSKHKRLELTDAELALGMWLYITLTVAMKDEVNMVNIPYIKQWYLACHNKNKTYWANSCYLCEKYMSNANCHRCPLHKAEGLKPTERGCSDKTWYGKLCSYYSTKEEKLSCCCKIIDVMRREA